MRPQRQWGQWLWRSGSGDLIHRFGFGRTYRSGRIRRYRGCRRFRWFIVRGICIPWRRGYFLRGWFLILRWVIFPRRNLLIGGNWISGRFLRRASFLVLLLAAIHQRELHRQRFRGWGSGSADDYSIELYSERQYDFRLYDYLLRLWRTNPGRLHRDRQWVQYQF